MKITQRHQDLINRYERRTKSIVDQIQGLYADIVDDKELGSGEAFIQCLEYTSNDLDDAVDEFRRQIKIERDEE